MERVRGPNLTTIGNQNGTGKTMIPFLYKLAKWGIKKFGPDQKAYHIKSTEEWDQLVQSGVKITSLSFEINNPSQEIDPWNKTLREICISTAQSNALFNRMLITLGDGESPDVLVWIVLSADMIERIMPKLEKLQEEL